MKKNRDQIVEKSSGNVFADLGLPNHEEALAKAKLMLLIKKTIERQGLTQAEAAKRIGIAQSDVSNLIRGRGRTYTMDKLFGILHALGGGITIEAKVGRKIERIPVFA
jgi:predicted XRE-type DNA-binding protein